MSLTAGVRLGPYEIVAPLGAGGMGEVYRARDTRLDRVVAIKILPDSLADDVQFRERFDREARAISQLDHPNICALHDVGEATITSPEPRASSPVRYLVMQFLEGETLEQRLRRGALPLDQALAVATQVASALDTAHRAGIVHRDLKPGNIMLVARGAPPPRAEDGRLERRFSAAGGVPTAKLLDFGLAKVVGPAVGSSSFSMLPTTPPAAMTAQGAILGTFQYMAPEQIEGQEADARSDIFAFGAVLYEMVTGKKAFEGKSQASLIAAIIEREPAPIATSQAESPPALDRVIRTCLSKDPNDRFHSAHDLLLQLKWITLGGPDAAAPTTAPVRTTTRGGVRLAIVAAAGVLLAIAAAWVAWTFKPEAPRPVRRFAVDLPEGAQLNMNGTRTILALSRDGLHLAYAGTGGLYLKTMNQLGAVSIAGTANAGSPFFSPDGQWIGFNQINHIKKVAVTGGAPLDICDTGDPFGVSWEGDTIYMGRGPDGIWQVPANGGMPTRLISVDATKEVAFGPQLLPGGKAMLFTLATQTGASQQDMWDNAAIVVEALDSHQRTIVWKGGSDARYVPTGHIVYVRQRTLLALPFDLKKRAATGNPIPVIDGIAFGGGGVQFGGQAGASQYAFSTDGLLTYMPQSAASAARTVLWVDRQGRETALPIPARPLVYPRLSPDGSRLAIDIRDLDQDIWIWDLARETLTRFTFAPTPETNPLWTPDGKRLVFSRAGQGIFWQAADGTGSAEQLTESGADVHAVASFSADGSKLLFNSNSSVGFDIKMVDVRDKRVTPVLAQPMINELNPEVSPDGKWLAYQSDESGQNEVYVRPFPGVQDGRWQISRAGGTRPRWSKDGRELYFLAGAAINTGGAALMGVSVDTTPAFRAGNPAQILPGPYFSGLAGRTYELSQDGRRFLMVKEQSTSATARIVAVENWFEELRQKAPTK